MRSPKKYTLEFRKEAVKLVADHGYSQASMIGELLTAADLAGHGKDYAIIVTADHGGSGFDHGSDSWIDRHIPWIVSGVGVAKGMLLTQEINTFDTAATALKFLDIAVRENWDGKVIEVLSVNEGLPTDAMYMRSPGTRAAHESSDGN